MNKTYVSNDSQDQCGVQSQDGQEELFRRKYQALLDAVMKQIDWLQHKRETLVGTSAAIHGWELDMQSQGLLKARLEAARIPRKIAAPLDPKSTKPEPRESL